MDTNGEQIHKCEICDQRFQSQESLGQHIEDHIARQQCFCGVCGADCESFEALEKHECPQEEETAAEMDHCCGECGEIFSTLEAVRAHVCRHVADVPSISSPETAMVSRSTNWKVVPYVHKVQKITEEYGDVALDLTMTGQSHGHEEALDLSMPAKRWAESIGDSSQPSLQHPASSDVTDDLQGEMEAQSTTIFTILSPMDNDAPSDNSPPDTITPSVSSPTPNSPHTTPKKSACHVCRKVFSSRTHLEIHSLTHKETDYECTKCGKDCYSGSGLWSHMRVHDKDWAAQGIVLPMHKPSIPDSPSKLYGHGTFEDENSHYSAMLDRLAGKGHSKTQHYPPSSKHSSGHVNRLKKGLKRNVVKSSPGRDNSGGDNELIHPPPIAIEVKDTELGIGWDHSPRDNDTTDSENGDDVIHPPPFMFDVDGFGTFDDELSDGGLGSSSQGSHDEGARNVMRGEKPYSCAMCDRQFTSKSSLEMHMKRHVEAEPEYYKCDICPELFSSAVSLRMHRRIHCGRPPFDCEWCNNTYSSAMGLWKHYVHFHENDYIRHQPTWSGDDDRSSSLSYCKSGFFKPREMTTEEYGSPVGNYSEENSLPPENLWKCQYCTKKFTSRALLVRHRATHKKKWKNKPKGPSGSQSLKVSHNNKDAQDSIPQNDSDKPFMCTICGRSFISAHGVKVHRFSHKNVADDAPSAFFRGDHKCMICSKHFARKITLTRHIRLRHKRVRCSICSVIFSSSVALKIHKRTHMYDRAFRCDLCPASFLSKSSLVFHNRTVHANDRVKSPKHDASDAIQDEKWTQKAEGDFGEIGGDTNPPNLTAIKEEFVESADFEQMGMSEGDLPSPPGVHKCPSCGRGFTTSRGMNVHLALDKRCAAIKAEPDVGGDGDEFFPEPSSSQDEEPTDPYRCKFCYKTLPTVRGRNIHLFYCTANSGSLLYRDDPSPGDHKCKVCFKSFSSSRGLGIHSFHCKSGEDLAEDEGEIPDGVFRCNLCPKYFSTNRGLGIHRFYHSSIDRKEEFPGGTKAGNGVDKPYACGVCEAGFSTMHGYKIHHAMQHPTLPKYDLNVTKEPEPLSPKMDIEPQNAYHCSICGRSFANNRGLKTHNYHAHSGPDGQTAPLSEHGTSGSSNVHGLQHSIIKRPYRCGQCFKRFTKLHGLQIHQFQHKLKKTNDGSFSLKKYRCPECDLGFPTERAMNIHRYNRHRGTVGSHHKKDTQRFGAPHIKPHFLSRKPHKCDQCIKSFNSERALKIHRFRSGHKRHGKFAVDHTPPELYDENIHFEPQSKPYKCDQCPRSFKSMRALNIHRVKKRHAALETELHGAATEHEPGRMEPPESIMQGGFQSQSRPFTCDQCPKSFATSRALNIHRFRRGHPPLGGDLHGTPLEYEKDDAPPPQQDREGIFSLFKPNKCDQCPKSFASTRDLNIHRQRQSHLLLRTGDAASEQRLGDTKPPGNDGASPVKLHRCDQCPKTFATARALNIHRFQMGHLMLKREPHAGSVQHKTKLQSVQSGLHLCTVCGARFSTISALHFHRAKHHKNAYMARQQKGSHQGSEHHYRCSICLDNFTTPKGLKLHRLMKHGHVVSQIKPAASPKKSSSPVKNPYKCAICDCSFASAPDLQSHVESHGKKAKCDKCLRIFSSSKALAAHQRVHATAATTNHSCPVCGGFFSRPGNLKRHMQLHERKRYISSSPVEDLMTLADDYSADETMEGEIE